MNFVLFKNFYFRFSVNIFKLSTYLGGMPSFFTPLITVQFGPVKRKRANFSSVRQPECP